MNSGIPIRTMWTLLKPFSVVTWFGLLLSVVLSVWALVALPQKVVFPFLGLSVGGVLGAWMAGLLAWENAPLIPGYRQAILKFVLAGFVLIMAIFALIGIGAGMPATLLLPGVAAGLLFMTAFSRRWNSSVTMVWLLVLFLQMDEVEGVVGHIHSFWVQLGSLAIMPVMIYLLVHVAMRNRDQMDWSVSLLPSWLKWDKKWGNYEQWEGWRKVAFVCVMMLLSILAIYWVFDWEPIRSESYIGPLVLLLAPMLVAQTGLRDLPLRWLSGRDASRQQLGRVFVTQSIGWSALGSLLLVFLQSILNMGFDAVFLQRCILGLILGLLYLLVFALLLAWIQRYRAMVLFHLVSLPVFGVGLLMLMTVSGQIDLAGLFTIAMMSLVLTILIGGAGIARTNFVNATIEQLA